MDKFTVLGFLITSIGTYLASITPWGFLVAAVGGVTFIYGQRRDSRSDVGKIEAKISEVRHEIASAREAASSPEEVQRLDHVDQEFRDWAADVVKNRERTQLQMEQTRLGVIESQLKKSDVWRPVLEYFLETIRRSVEAYAAETQTHVAVVLPPLPRNLFDVNTSYEAKMFFNPKVTWLFELDRTSGVGMSAFPVMWIFQAAENPVRLAYLWSSDLKDEIFLTVLSETLRSLPGVQASFPINDYRAGLRAAAQRLVQAQVVAFSA